MTSGGILSVRRVGRATFGLSLCGIDDVHSVAAAGAPEHAAAYTKARFSGSLNYPKHSYDLTVLDTELIKTLGEPLVEKGPVVRDLHGIAVNR